jgi:hypothetical protein|tara:strand:+ start:121 stop:978 length:858 start_codon:yes stop_codon:yes gene_type:complete
MDAVEDYVRRKEEYDAQDIDVRRSIYRGAIDRIVRAFRCWKIRKSLRIVRFVYKRHVANLVEGHLEPDRLASQKYAAKYADDYWQNGLFGLKQNDVTRWWYRKENVHTITICAKLLRAGGCGAWHPNDKVAWEVNGKRKRMTALRALYEVPQQPTGFPRTGLNPDGTLCSWAQETPKPFVFPREIPWTSSEIKTVTRLVAYTCALAAYYKYEDVRIGFGNVYEDEGLWTVVGPAYDVNGCLYTTWYRSLDGQRGSVARLQTEVPRGVLRGVLKSRGEVETLFDAL